MHVKSTIIAPTRLEFNLTPYWSPDTPVTNVTYKDVASIEVHDADDEQIAVAFDAGLVDEMRVIVDRDDDAQPFIVFDVVLPGVVVKYYWMYRGERDASKVHVLVRFGETMHDYGVNVPLARLKHMAGIEEPSNE